MALREDVSERAHARVGTVLRSKWRLDAVIGIGGMASVYAATHRNNSRVAIKMLHPEVAIDQEVTSRFLREGYVANAVGHPSTVMVLDDDVSEDGAPFLVMELLEGETLDSRLMHGGLFSIEEATLVAEQVLDVLAAAHDKQIVHRDIKPENLFLTNLGLVKVLDFGIARLRELSFSTGGGTRAGAVLGTPAFMAPEQALGRWGEVDGRTDIWAVGAMLYTLVTGRSVHEGDTVQAQLVLAATRSAPPLLSVAPRATPEFARVVDRALAFDRHARFPDARSMQAAFREVSDGFLGLGTLGPRTAQRTVTVDQGPTLVAPSGPVIAASASSESSLQAQGMSRSTAASPGRTGWVRYAIGGAVVVAIAVAVLRGVGPRPPIEPVTDISTATQAPSGSLLPREPDVTASPEVRPATATSTSPPLIATSPPKKPPVKIHKTPPSKPSGTSVVTGPPKPPENPFDKRH
jgi:serine/threonine-protein kinase